MTDPTAYHLAELRLIEDRSNPRRCVPNYDCTGWDVLDVGCGLGQTLMAPEFSMARSRHGIDVDQKAIDLGHRMFPALLLSVAHAECIPYRDGTFDLVFSRVALPYTNVPAALAEMHRVAKPGGRVWLTLHSWAMERQTLLAALRHFSGRRLLDQVYVVMNSLLLALAERCIARPWSGTYESFQFVGSMMRLMRKLEFCEVSDFIDAHLHFCMSARKAPTE